LRGPVTDFRVADDNASVKINSLGKGRIAFMYFMAVIPRVIITISLGVIGVMYLLNTRALADLLLNSMCLAFVLDMDELVYEAFAPDRIKMFRDLLEPVEYSRHAVGRLAHPQGVFLGITVVALLFIYFFAISDIMLMIAAVEEVLCEGNTHFVYSLSAATERVLAAPSFYSDDEEFAWTNTEYALLQLARPDLDPRFFSEDAIAASESTDTWAWLQPVGTTSLDEAEPTTYDVDLIFAWSQATVAETVESMSCTDLCGNGTNNTAVATVLGRSIGTEPIYCEAALEKCWLMNMTAMRTNCGQSCGCGSAKPDFAGFFQVQYWGCPHGCSTDRKIDLYNYDCYDSNITAVMQNDMWVKYVQGMKSYVFHVDGYASRIQTDLVKYHELVGIKTDEVDAVHAFVTGDGFWDSLANYRYLLAENVPHPSNLTGCQFLTSNAVLMILNIDVCDTSGDFTSLKSICPTSCQCSIYPAACPPACFD